MFIEDLRSEMASKSACNAKSQEERTRRTATLKNLFDEIDTDKSGDIGIEELRKRLGSKGYSDGFIEVCFALFILTLFMFLLSYWILSTFEKLNSLKMNFFVISIFLTQSKLGMQSYGQFVRAFQNELTRKLDKVDKKDKNHFGNQKNKWKFDWKTLILCGNF